MRDKQGKFQKGRSGNPGGKIPGTRNKATQAALKLLDGEVEALTRKAVELALEGDTTALRLCLERIAPPAKEHRLEGLELPEINGPQDVLDAVSEVSLLLAEGAILPSQAAALCQVFDHYRRHYETSELEERITQLEGQK
jgi:hypothetical protein